MPFPIREEAPHPLRSTLKDLPKDSIHRQAHELAAIIAALPSDPTLQLKPRAIAVGSFPLQGAAARDLDFEVQGVPWEKLQQHFAGMAGRNGIAKVVLTSANADGVVQTGNAFVAVWLTLEGGRSANLSVPTLVDGNSSRYNIHSVEHRPDLPFAPAARRRLFAHNAVGYDPLQGPYGVLEDPFDGRNALKRNQLKIIHREAFATDPLNIYIAVRELTTRGMNLDPDSERLIKGVVAAPARSGADVVQVDRLAYERTRLFTSDAPPSAALNCLRNLGVIQAQFPEIHALFFELGRRGKADTWNAVLKETDRSWANARAQAQWTPEERAALVLGRLRHELESVAAAEKIAFDGSAALQPFDHPYEAGPEGAKRQHRLAAQIAASCAAFKAKV